MFWKKKPIRAAPPRHPLPQPFDLPTEIDTTLSIFMDMALLLVTIENGMKGELILRQRTAACALGAVDWLCQVRGVARDEIEWMQVSVEVATKYMAVGDSKVFARFPAEVIGMCLANITNGQGDMHRCMLVGGNAMKSWVMNHSQDAPLDVTRCIMGVEG